MTSWPTGPGPQTDEEMLSEDDEDRPVKLFTLHLIHIYGWDEELVGNLLNLLTSLQSPEFPELLCIPAQGD